MKIQDIFTEGLWRKVLRSLPRDLEESARTYGAVTRVRNIPSAANLLRMIFAYSLSDLSLKDIAAWAKADGIADVTGQAFHYRLMRSEKWLEFLLGRLLFRECRENPIGFPVRVIDGTVITGPGSKGTDWIAHMIVDPFSGRFTSVELTDAKGAETFMRHAVYPGELVLGDRMYATARGIEFVNDRGAYPLVRVNLHTLKICNRNKKRVHLQFLEKFIRDNGTISLDILVPTPPDMAGKKSKSWDLKDAKLWIPARLVGGPTKKGVIWVLTTLSRDQLSDESVLKLYRLRWQVELLFKRLKSLLHLDTLPTKDGPISKSWLLGRLLVAATAQDLVAPTGLFSPRNSVRRRRIDLQSEFLVKIPRSTVGNESHHPWKGDVAPRHHCPKP